MVITYRNRFIKVFLISLFLFGVVIIGTIWVRNVIVGAIDDSSGVPSDSILIIAKWMNALLAPIAILATTLYFYSHYLLAKAKGYNGWLMLLALINIFGTLILFLLPDRRQTG